MSEAAPTIKARLAALPPEPRRVLLGMALFALGTGLTLPFLLVYLHQVRGISTQTAGLLIAWVALGSLFTGPLWGSAIDRIGPMAVLRFSLLIEACGVFCLAFVDDVLKAFGAVTLVAIGSSGGWPGQTALLARIVRPRERSWLFGLQFMLLNLGIGIGGLIAGLVVDVDSLGSFQSIYALDALGYLAYFAVLMTLSSQLGRHEIADESSDTHTSGGEESSTVTAGGYRRILQHRAFLQLLATASLLVVFGYAQIEVGLAAYATQVMGLDARWLGVAFAANTGTIVLGQLFVLARLEGRSRSVALGGTGVLWGLSWLALSVSGISSNTTVLVLALITTATVFALGETIWSPTFPALVNDLAPDDLRGRYNALSTMTWSVGGVLGPVFAGFLLGSHHSLLWVYLTVAGCWVGAVLAVALRRVLSPVEDGRVSSASATMEE